MFRDDMISDGIENCVQYIHNFDPIQIEESFCIFYSNHTLCIFKKNTKRKETVRY